MNVKRGYIYSNVWMLKISEKFDFLKQKQEETLIIYTHWGHSLWWSLPDLIALYTLQIWDHQETTQLPSSHTTLHFHCKSRKRTQNALKEGRPTPFGKEGQPTLHSSSHVQRHWRLTNKQITDYDLNFENQKSKILPGERRTRGGAIRNKPIGISISLLRSFTVRRIPIPRISVW